MRIGSSTWTALFGGALVIVLGGAGGCGGDDAVSIPPEDAGGTNDATTPQNDASAGMDTGTANDSSSPPDAPSGNDATPPLDAGGDAPLSCTPSPPNGAACNSLAPSGAPIASSCSNAKPGIPKGGTIADGTYVLTSTTFFGTCPPAEQDRITWQICGSSWQSVQESTVNGQPGKTTTVNANVAKAGAQLTYGFTCPQNMNAANGAYDVTPTTLTLYFPMGIGSTRVDVFTKQ